MNIDNLKAGQLIKDYPSLCLACGLKKTTGEAKQKQMKELSNYVKLKKLARGYIVEEIIGFPDPMITNPSSSLYTKCIETLLMAHFTETKSKFIEATYKQLFQILCMSSRNYNDIYIKESYDYIHDNIAPISEDVHADFRRVSYNENKRKIKCALESMKNRMMIDYKEYICVCYKDEDGNKVYKEPPTEEIDEYISIGKALLEKYGCNNADDLDTKHTRKKYEKELSKILKEKLGWRRRYKKLRIINTLNDSVDLLEKAKKDLVLQARKNNIEISKSELNTAIKNMLNRIGENNHKNTLQKLEEWERGDEEWGSGGIELPNNLKMTLFRAKENYLPAWNILSDYYIEGNEKAAKDRAMEYPVDTDKKEVNLSHLID